MRPRFMLNIGKGYAANADTVKYIISADAETRSLIMHHDGTMAISSISKSSLIKRFQGEEQQKELD